MHMPSVLVVEDDPDLSELIQDLFAQVGWEVHAERNGHAALRSLRKSKPDVLVTDCMMPQMGGRELIERVRAMPELRQLPVILMSGADSLLEGMDDPKPLTLRKPFDPEKLVDMARGALHRH